MIKKGLLALNIVLLLLTLASTFSTFVNPNSFWLASLISVSFPIWIALNVIMIIYWAIIEPRYSLVSFVGLLLCCNSVLNLFNWNSHASSDDKEVVRVMTYNLGGTYYLSKKERQKRNKWMPRDILSKKIDIMAFQEAGSKVQFKDEFIGYDQHHFSTSGTSIYSKFPIVKKGSIDIGSRTNSIVWADVEIRKKIYRFFSVHLKSNKISSSDIDALNDINRDYEKNLQETKSVFKKYVRQSKTRSQQVKKLLEAIENSPHPVIVCGDFNEPPYSYVYKNMSAKLCDTFREKGKGFAATFAGKIPFLRIDYIFIDKSITPVKHWVGEDEWSDHFPLMADLEL